MATLTVGTGKQYTTLATALDAARDGDVVAVTSGTYVNDFGTVHTKVTLAAVGGLVTLLATRPLASGQAILTVTTDAVIDGFVFAGARAADGTAAGLRDTGGALVVRNSLFTTDDTGLLVPTATVGTAGTVLVQTSEFAGNGAGDGFSGNVSVGAVASLTIQDSYIHDAKGGDEIKSLAKATTITGSRIVDSTATVAAAAAGTPVAAATTKATVTASDIDLPKGGVITIQNTVIEKGPDTAGPAIRIGGDTAYAVTSISITNDTLVSDRAGTTAVQNTTPAVAVISGDKLYGFAAVATGLAILTNDTVPTTRPVIATTALVALPATTTPIVTTATPVVTTTTPVVTTAAPVVTATAVVTVTAPVVTATTPVVTTTTPVVTATAVVTAIVPVVTVTAPVVTPSSRRPLPSSRPLLSPR